MFKNTGRAWFFTVGAVALIVGLLVVRHIHLSPDSMTYALVADQIRSGRGLRAPTFLLTAQPDGAGTIPFTLHSPLLPVLLAIVGGVRPGHEWPAQAINVVALVVSSLSGFFLVRRLAGVGAGVAAGIAVAIFCPVLMTFRYVWSEPAFIAFVLASVSLTVAARSRQPRGKAYLLLAGLSAAAAVATRLIGVVFIPMFGWEALRTWRRRGFGPAVGVFAYSGLLPLLCFAALFVRGLLLSGSVRGVDLLEIDRTFGQAMQEMLVGTINSFGIWNFGPKALLAGSAPVGAAALILYSSVKGSKIGARLARRGFDALLWAAGSYFVLFSWAMATHQPSSEWRFWVPLAVLVLLAVIVLIRWGWHVGSRRTLRQFRALRRAGWLVTLALLCAYLAYDTTGRLDVKPQKVTTAETKTFAWIMEHCPPPALVTTNRNAQLAYLGGYSAMDLPGQFYRIPNDMRTFLPKRMAEVGSRYMVLFANKEGLPEEHNGDFVAALSRRQQLDCPLKLVFQCEDGAVYALKEVPGVATP